MLRYSQGSIPRQRVSYRQIGEADIPNIATLLVRGFPKRNREFWLRALGQLSRRQPPWGLPKYGCVLESDEQAERKLAIDVGAEMVPAIGVRTEIVSAGKRSIETAAYHPPQNVRQNKSIRKNQLSQMPLLTSTAAAPKAWQR